MISFTFAEIAQITSGELIQLDAGTSTTASPVIDSRRIDGSEQFFCAFNGESVDGNDFAQNAIERGAKFILTEKALDLPSIKVADVQTALTALARVARSRLAAKVIGITGSQGKTTTKELLREVLATQGAVIAPEGSFNNELGLPLTVLSADANTRFVILEMGARHTGDIAYLTDIAQPDVGVVLVVGSAHLGEFGSIEKLAATKAELIEHLPDGAIAVLGDYDPYTPTFGANKSLRRIIFGEKAHDEIRAADIELRGGRAHFDLVAPDGRATVGLKVLGEHHIANALAAAAVGSALGIGVETIAVALSEAELSTKWRMELHEVGGRTLINDSYNANPESMAAAIKTAALMTQESGGSCWAFLGKMHELGASEVESHLEIGRLASRFHIDHLVEVGGVHFAPAGTKELDGMDLLRAADVDEAMRFAEFIQPGDLVVVKASRAEGLEKLAQKLLDYFASDAVAVNEESEGERE